MSMTKVTEIKGKRVTAPIMRESTMLKSLNLKISKMTRLKMTCLKVTMM